MSSQINLSNLQISPHLPEIHYLALEKLLGYKRQSREELLDSPKQLTYVPYILAKNKRIMIIQDGDLLKHVKLIICKYISLYSGVHVVFNTKKHAASIKMTGERKLSDMCMFVIMQTLTKNLKIKFDSLHSAQKFRDKLFSLNLPTFLSVKMFFYFLPNYSVILEETRQVTRLKVCPNDRTCNFVNANIEGNLYEDFFCWTCGSDLFENYVPFVLNVENIVK
nr:hypothetical protein TnSNPV_134 [Trichoplusia ni single nucleopolyhedrovirus]